jgi:hypothetical protein
MENCKKTRTDSGCGMKSARVAEVAESPHSPRKSCEFFPPTPAMHLAEMANWRKALIHPGIPANTFPPTPAMHLAEVAEVAEVAERSSRGMRAEIKDGLGTNFSFVFSRFRVVFTPCWLRQGCPV